MAENDLADLRKQCITSLYLCSDNVSKYLDSEKEAEFDKLKVCVQQNCTSETRQKVIIKAMMRAKRETDSSNEDTLEARFKSYLRDITRARIRAKNDHSKRMEFQNGFRIGLLTPAHESDLSVTESQDQYLDPITKRPVTDPVKNSGTMTHL